MITTLKEKSDLKYSNVDWFGKIPKDWRVEKIKAHFKLSKERASAENNDVLSLTQRGIKVRDISNNEGQLAASYDNYAKLRKGDIVLNPMDLVSGYVDLSDREGIISPAYTVLRKKKTDLNLEYAKHFFQWHYIFNIFFPFGRGVSVDHRWTLGDDVLMNFPIMIPPVETQGKVAEFLDEKTNKISEIINKKKKLIELLKEKRTSLITKIVTEGIDPNSERKSSSIDFLKKIPKSWKEKKLKFVAEVLASNIDKHSYDGEKGVLLCNYVDVYNNEIICDNLDFMRATASVDQIKKLKLRKGYVIITKDSETADDIGVPAFIQECSDNLVCGYHLYLIKNNKEISGKFLFRLLQAKPYRSMFELKANGVTRFGLGSYGAKNIKIPIPSLDVQKKIVNAIDKKANSIDKAISNIQQQMKRLKEYRASLIYNAVTGKIQI